MRGKLLIVALFALTAKADMNTHSESPIKKDKALEEHNTTLVDDRAQQPSPTPRRKLKSHKKRH